MKKIKMSVLSIVIFILFLVGCQGLQIQPQEQDIALKVLSRHAGIQLVKADQNIAKMLIPYLETIVKNSNDTTELYGFVRKILTEKLDELDNPILTADIQDMLDVIKMKLPEIIIPEDKIKLIKTCASGFLSGINLQLSVIR